MSTKEIPFENSFIIPKAKLISHQKLIPFYSEETISALSKSSVKQLVPYFQQNNQIQLLYLESKIQDMSSNVDKVKGRMGI